MPMKTPPHPGDLIKTEIIEALGLTVSKAAEILNVRRATLSDLLHGKAALTPEMALRIERRLVLTWTIFCACSSPATWRKRGGTPATSPSSGMSRLERVVGKSPQAGAAAISGTKTRPAARNAARAMVASRLVPACGTDVPDGARSRFRFETSIARSARLSGVRVASPGPDGPRNRSRPAARGGLASLLVVLLVRLRAGLSRRRLCVRRLLLARDPPGNPSL